MPTLIASTNITGLQLKEGTAPTTPASGYLRIYAASDSTCHILNDGASDIDVSGLATGKIGLASQAANDLQYASSSTQWARIANGTTGQILTATTAGAPGWAAPAVPTTITVADTTSATCYVSLFESATGNLAPKSDAGLSYNASTGVLYATGFNGPITGAVTGNASTATKLATARAINGVDFDGSAAITVTAAAGTLSGNTLASGVTASSLTSVGAITTGVWNAGAITSSGAFTGLAAYSDTRKGGPSLSFQNADSTRYWLIQPDTANSLFIDHYNGTAWARHLTITTAGVATFASSIKGTSVTGEKASGSDTLAAGPFLGVSASSNAHQWIIQLGATSGLDFNNYNGAWNEKVFRIGPTGNTTIGGTLTIGTNLISYGANDSAGTGYRLVRVPNA